MGSADRKTEDRTSQNSIRKEIEKKKLRIRDGGKRSVTRVDGGGNDMGKEDEKEEEKGRRKK